MRRAKTEVLQHFEAGLREADVPGTGWATAAEAAALRRTWMRSSPTPCSAGRVLNLFPCA